MSITSNLQQWLHALPNQSKIKEVYIDVTWHQPGSHVGAGTLSLIGIIVIGIVALAAIAAYVSQR